MTRLFTLGCSFTRYHWPTWANILARSFEESENWGSSGIGNRGILERLVEINLKKKLTKHDLVIIQWTNPHRFDFHSDVNGWLGTGNIHNKNSKIPRRWVEEIWNERSFVMHTANFILAAKQILDSIGCQYYFLSMSDIISDINKYSDFNRYSEELLLANWKPPMHDWFVNSNLPRRSFSEPKKMLSYGNFVKAGSDFVKVEDQHPTPWAHYLYLAEFLEKDLAVELDSKWAKQAEDILDNVISYLQMADVYLNRLSWDNIYSCTKGF